jgi:CRISPR-associated protein Cas5t
MRVLRVELQAQVCSFRYAHFLVGKQLSFDMPPPATIYGHIASALGELPEPASFRFAYRFTVGGRGEDLENQHIIIAGGRPFPVGASRFRPSTTATVQPTRRQFLFDCRLTLYLDRLDLEQAFWSPRFPVILGRSQDLACYVSIGTVDLEPAERGYYEDTILPGEFRRRTGRGVTVLMPRYISPPPRRDAAFDRYILLRERIYDGPATENDLGTRQMIRSADEDVRLLVDPDSPEWRGAHRALAFHCFN